MRVPNVVGVVGVVFITRLILPTARCSYGLTCAAVDTPEDLHEWISFDDPDEHRTWVFDATFLRSDYMCIYGCGCKGILDEPSAEPMQGCCSVGAHFIDRDDSDNVALHFERVEPRQMQFHAKAVKKGPIRRGKPDDGPETKASVMSDSGGEPPLVTRLADGACIFLNRPGFAGGTGCALHIAAVEAGERPLDWKPQVCWQVPLRLEHSTDESGHVTSRVREWKRRDWGDGGADFGWWCTEEPEAFVGREPLYLSARDEIVEMVGEDNYRRLVSLLERADWVPLPHPAVRR
jgi:hypothetical protein